MGTVAIAVVFLAAGGAAAAARRVRRELGLVDEALDSMALLGEAVSVVVALGPVAIPTADGDRRGPRR